MGCREMTAHFLNLVGNGFNLLPLAKRAGRTVYCPYCLRNARAFSKESPAFS